MFNYLQKLVIVSEVLTNVFCSWRSVTYFINYLINFNEQCNAASLLSCVHSDMQRFHFGLIVRQIMPFVGAKFVFLVQNILFRFILVSRSRSLKHAFTTVEIYSANEIHLNYSVIKVCLSCAFGALPKNALESLFMSSILQKK